MHTAVSDCANCPKTVVQAAAKLVKVALGVGLVDAETLKERDATCGACPHLLPGAVRMLRKCELCGCFIGAKTRLAEERCPDQPPRWEALAQNK